jgi:hypothetical protein
MMCEKGPVEDIGHVRELLGALVIKENMTGRIAYKMFHFDLCFYFSQLYAERRMMVVSWSFVLYPYTACSLCEEA